MTTATSTSLVLLVTGDRWWGRPDPKAVDKAADIERVSRQRKVMWDALLPVERQYSHVQLVHGTAKGADTLAHQFACMLGWSIVEYPPNWRIGPGAGPVRNRQMIGYVSAFSDRHIGCFAFHDDLDLSKGTRNCVMQALDAEIPTQVFP